ncbi:MAG: Wzz/FepE/Etk N-terminal domain-containing protein [Eubacterium sp.]|nr:Wzz/FepE/Etk N-terminal domain-containing protein [Eubacterium sp.]
MEEEINLQDIFDMLKKNWRFIAIVTLCCMIVASVVTVFFINKQYSSYTTLMIGKAEGYSETNSNANYNDVLTNQKLVGTYSEIAKSNSIVSEVIKNLGLDMTNGELAAKIDVSSVNDTELIKISVKDSDPVEAANIADETAKVFMTNIAELMKINNLQVVDPAEVNPNPVSPSLPKNIAIAFLLGIVVSVFIAFVREMFNTSIKSVDELKDLIGDIPVVAIIPHSDELMADNEGGKK